MITSWRAILKVKFCGWTKFGQRFLYPSADHDGNAVFKRLNPGCGECGGHHARLELHGDGFAVVSHTNQHVPTVAMCSPEIVVVMSADHLGQSVLASKEIDPEPPGTEGCLTKLDAKAAVSGLGTYVAAAPALSRAAGPWQQKLGRWNPAKRVCFGAVGS